MSEPPGSNAGRPKGDLLSTVVVPVADQDDARATAKSLAGLLDDDRAVVVHVVQHTKGGLDTASVEQLKADAESIFAAAGEVFDGAGIGGYETRLVYDTDVAAAIFRVAEEADATAISFTPRGGSRWVRLLTGDVALDLVTDTDRPVVVLPDVDDGDGSATPTGTDDSRTDGGDEPTAGGGERA
jgi:nucleotide-binding universal stress UspA family protein